MSYIISELLTEDQVSQIRSTVNSSQDWVDGMKSIISHKHPSNNGIKKNLELDHKSDAYQKACPIIFNALLRCVDWADFTVFDTSGPVMFSKTHQGGYYKTHFDAPNIGEYSNTVFLSDTDEYSGGELVLMLSLIHI